MRPLVSAVVVAGLIAAIDAAAGSRLVLIGALTAAPVIATASGRARHVLLASLWAVGLSVALGPIDGVWRSWEHAAFLGAVIVVSIVSTTATAVLELALRSRSHALSEDHR